MDLRKIKALIEAVTEGDVDELEVESKEGTVRIRRNSRSEDGAAPYLVMSNPALPVSSTSSALPASTEELVGSDGDHAKDTADASSDNSDDLDGLKVVVDCANGAAYKVAPEILWELGAEVIPVAVEPDGFNINKGCGSTDTAFMCKQVAVHGADIGLALDGDADRLIIADEHGELINGDQIMAVIAERWAGVWR